MRRETVLDAAWQWLWGKSRAKRILAIIAICAAAFWLSVLGPTIEEIEER